MMATKMTRQHILDRLRKEIGENRPIFGAGCSAGIIAKCAELGKADLIIVYSTGKTRMMGLLTTIIGPSNLMAQSPLFTPISIGKLMLLGRLVKSATTETRCTEDGFVTDSLIEYYAQIAQGGTPLRAHRDRMLCEEMRSESR